MVVKKKRIEVTEEDNALLEIESNFEGIFEEYKKIVYDEKKKFLREEKGIV